MCMLWCMCACLHVCEGCEFKAELFSWTLPEWGCSGGLCLGTSASPSSPASAMDSMQELYEEMKLLAFDLQDNNRVIER